MRKVLVHWVIQDGKYGQMKMVILAVFCFHWSALVTLCLFLRFDTVIWKFPSTPSKFKISFLVSLFFSFPGNVKKRDDGPIGVLTHWPQNRPKATLWCHDIKLFIINQSSRQCVNKHYLFEINQPEFNQTEENPDPIHFEIDEKRVAILVVFLETVEFELFKKRHRKKR